MNKNALILVLAGAILVIGICTWGYRTHSTETDTPVLAELSRLDIHVTGGPVKQLQIELPADLSDADWGPKNTICAEGGYDLSRYANKTLLFTVYPTNQVWSRTDPLNVWVVTDGDTLVCVYRAVTEKSTAAPGIFSIKPTSSITTK